MGHRTFQFLPADYVWGLGGMEIGRQGIRGTKSSGPELQASLQETKNYLGKWIHGSKQSQGIRQKRWERTYKTTNWEEEFSQHGRWKGEQDTVPALKKLPK